MTQTFNGKETMTTLKSLELYHITVEPGLYGGATLWVRLRLHRSRGGPEYSDWGFHSHYNTSAQAEGVRRSLETDADDNPTGR